MFKFLTTQYLKNSNSSITKLLRYQYKIKRICLSSIKEQTLKRKKNNIERLIFLYYSFRFDKNTLHTKRNYLLLTCLNFEQKKNKKYFTLNN